MSKNFKFSIKKHIDVRYHLIKDVLKNKSLQLIKIHSKRNISDIITKIVTKKYIFTTRIEQTHIELPMSAKI